MKLIRVITIVAAAIAVAGCSADGAGTTRSEGASTTARTSAVDADARRITYAGQDGKTALALLRENGYDVQTEKSSLGEYVTAIGDVKAAKSAYWLYYVDGNQPSVGADKYKTRDGQRIEWKFTS